MQIFVLGMHRSGTSAFTRLINLMGAQIGPAERIGVAAPDNEKGFLDRTDVSSLNEGLLGAIECSWDDPCGYPAEGLIGGVPRELAARVERFVFEMDLRRP